MLIVGILRGGRDMRAAAVLDSGGTWVAGNPALVLAGFALRIPAPSVLAAMLAGNVLKDSLAFRRFLTRGWICNPAPPAAEVLPAA
jgi:Na+-driven multidrug efflux pump